MTGESELLEREMLVPCDSRSILKIKHNGGISLTRFIAFLIGSTFLICMPVGAQEPDVSKVEIGTEVNCPIDFEEGQFKVKMELPDIYVEARAYGQCQTDACVCVPFTDDCACVCIARSTVDMTAFVGIQDINLAFTVTEANLEEFSVDQHPVFDAGAKVDLGAEGDLLKLECIGGDLCQFFVDVFEFISGNDDLLHVDIEDEIQFSTHIEAAKRPDPVGLNELKIDKQVVEGFFQNVEGTGPNVEINEHGIIAGLEGHFATTKVDLGIPPNPGIALTPAPIPSLPIPNAEDVLIGLSDDAINMMFASLTAAGSLKVGDAQGCFSTGLTIDALLPANCDSLNLGNDLASVAARAYCHAIKGDNCATLVYNNPALSPTDNANLTAGEIGACWGAQGLPTGKSCWDVSEAWGWPCCGTSRRIGLQLMGQCPRRREALRLSVFGARSRRYEGPSSFPKPPCFVRTCCKRPPGVCDKSRAADRRDMASESRTPGCGIAKGQLR